MGSSPSRLTPLQRDLLDAFFAREQRFALTGGAALAGFYFGHRRSSEEEPDVRASQRGSRRGRAACAAAGERVNSPG
jgi:hypothetical protein